MEVQKIKEAFVFLVPHIYSNKWRYYYHFGSNWRLKIVSQTTAAAAVNTEPISQINLKFSQ